MKFIKKQIALYPLTKKSAH